MPTAQGHLTTAGNATGDVRYHLTLSPQLNAALERLAEQGHSTKGDVLRKAIALFDVAAEAKEKGQRLAILDGEGKVVEEIVGI